MDSLTKDIKEPDFSPEDKDIFLEQYAEEIKRLTHVIDRDRYIVAYGIESVKNTLKSREWLCEGRGPYTYDDEDYQKEFGQAIDEIYKSLSPLKRVALNLHDCTRNEERVKAARDAAMEFINEPIGHRDMIHADLFSDSRDRQIKDLEAQIEGFKKMITVLVNVKSRKQSSWFSKLKGFFEYGLSGH